METATVIVFDKLVDVETAEGQMLITLAIRDAKSAGVTEVIIRWK